MSDVEHSESDDDALGKLPYLPWCRDCWDQAADGTRRERNGDLPDECEKCGSDEVFWI